MAGINFNSQLPKNWRVKIMGQRYTELWIRRYASLRHFERCTVLCSDYANHMTERDLPLVRDLDLDRKLLVAHTKILAQSGKTVRCKV